MITQTSTPQLFEHRKTGTRVIVTQTCKLMDALGGTAFGVIYEMARGSDDRDEEPFVRRIEDFEAQYKEVHFECGVDIYAILHEVLTKTVAVKVSRKIEAALAAVKGKD